MVLISFIIIQIIQELIIHSGVLYSKRTTQIYMQIT